MVEDPYWRAVERSIERFDLVVAAAKKSMQELHARALTIAPNAAVRTETLAPEANEKEPLKKAS